MWLRIKSILLVIVALTLLPTGAFASRQEPIYNVTLVSSTNLLQEGNLIHRNDNRWVHDLEKNIDDQLGIARTAER